MLNLLILFSGIAALAAPHADRAAVARIDRTFQEAVKRNDAETMRRILHPKFQLVLGDGRRFDREDLLADARRGRFTYELQDEEAGTQSVLVWGDTAIVTAKLLMKGTQEGKQFERSLWFSDTYVRTNRGWRYIFGQASLPLPSERQVSESQAGVAEHPFAISYWPAGGF